ncbi:MAG: UDP-N-acetylglucosamine 1-carboxyvinyltransferase [Oscillospiraceae bacterium]|nr:UDP-N-acetylglucosamine 1-carboxyvinyltransferase [Oscillospiraceae bacterium]
MGDYIIRGKRPLAGVTAIPAAKNSVLPIIAASVLCKTDCHISGVPWLTDVEAACGILKELGYSAERCGTELYIRPGQSCANEIPPRLMKAMRSSVFFLAPILCRTGKAVITMPGGCDLGARPIDIHLEGLQALGAKVSENADGRVICTAPKGLRGASFTLRLPSVGATETMLMAASAAEGVTRLYNTAAEPEVEDLACFLNACGARISGAGTGVITIEGVPELYGCRYTPIPDRIAAFTVLCGVAAAGGSARLLGAKLDHLQAPVDCLRQAGMEIEEVEGGICARSDGRLNAAFAVSTGAYPGFATDAAPLLAAGLLAAKGSLTVTDTIFSNRFACAKGFAALGAQVSCHVNTLVCGGGAKLKGAALQAEDLRGGAALVVAALGAEGESRVSGSAFIRRGYEDIAGMFASLGAYIRAEE